MPRERFSPYAIYAFHIAGVAPYARMPPHMMLLLITPPIHAAFATPLRHDI